jgi:hypothetical protein
MSDVEVEIPSPEKSWRIVRLVPRFRDASAEILRGHGLACRPVSGYLWRMARPSTRATLSMPVETYLQELLDWARSHQRGFVITIFWRRSRLDPRGNAPIVDTRRRKHHPEQPAHRL